MRPFEIALIAALFVTLAAAAAALLKADPGSGLLPKLPLACLAMAAVALLLHLSLEGAHWQLAPAYIAFLPALLLARWLLDKHAHNPFPPTLAGCLLLVIACAAAYVVPIFQLPVPTGPYSIGTTILYLVDHHRAEDAGPHPGGPRELMVQLWYPSDATSGRRAVYRRREETTFQSAYQALIKTNSYLDAGVAHSGRPYPVLLFNPGWTGRRTQNTFLTEELASHGYIVAAIDHTYNSTPVAFPDGRLILGIRNPKIEEYRGTTPEELESIGNRETDKHALDDRFVLDELTRMNQQQGSLFHLTMDVTNAGALGHSMGGGASVQAWATDPRIRAALNLDGWTFGTQAASGRRAMEGLPLNTPPLLFLYEDGYYPDQVEQGSESPVTHTWTPGAVEAAVDNWDRHHVNLLIRQYGGYWLNLKGSIHPTFTDKILTSPLSRLSGVGPINPQLAHRIVRDYAVQFFDQALKNKPSPLLTANPQTKYPEIITSLHPPATP